MNTIETTITHPIKEQKCWELIKEANWKLDHSYKRISSSWAQLPREEFEMLKYFIDKKVNVLCGEFESHWLGRNGFNNGKGIPVSDDSWSDLCYDVVGRGEDFYNSITVEKLLQMAESHDYEESFGYCLLLD